MTGNPLQEILSAISTPWDQCPGTGREVLRLTLLRDLHRKLHAQRTQFLSEGQSSDIQLIEAWVDRIRTLRSAKDLDAPLAQLLNADQKVVRVERQLPKDLPAEIQPKLLRKDREWEKAIAAEGFARGWNLWTLDLKMDLRAAETTHNRVLEQLWPKGVYLFVEPGSPGAPQPGTWHGRWFIMTSPELQDPPQSLPEIARAGRDPEWKQVFPPSTR